MQGKQKVGNEKENKLVKLKMIIIQKKISETENRLFEEINKTYDAPVTVDNNKRDNSQIRSQDNDIRIEMGGVITYLQIC